MRKVCYSFDGSRYLEMDSRYLEIYKIFIKPAELCRQFGNMVLDIRIMIELR